jgi:hypothetical protein
MTKFTDLFWSHPELGPAGQQDYVEAQLPAVVAQSNLHLWQPGDPVAHQGKRILLGVATYSIYDMRLLDVLDEEAGRRNGQTPRLDVFSVARCRTHEDFARYIPDLGTVLQTPVVGVWEGGALKEKGQGKPARDLALEA